MSGSSALVGLSIIGFIVTLVPDDKINPAYQWVAFQLLSAAGSSAIGLATAVGSQASAPHTDLATLVGLTDALVRSGSILGARIGYISGPTPIVLFALATGFAILCAVASYFMPTFILGDEHNAVERKEEAIPNDPNLTV